MKIILLKDVKSLGKKDAVVDISDGYARNLILPKKLGVEATQKNLNELKLQQKHSDKLAQEKLAAAQALAEEIKEKQVEIKVKTGEGGRIFGSVSAKEVATAAKEQLNLELDKKKLLLSEGIKALGTYEVGVKLHQEVTAQLRVKVVEG
ncbi:50S ribosomal protein L9 [Clostridia bacterium]|nr:50S ribosomal protein L9 [Clostridia bacterium]